jgi:DNA-binding winged helix-turn-helix (wHTH) protein/tetratricopeptide (TPR) repeat protein
MPNTLFCFGEFELDLGKYELLHKGKQVKLERLPMELLILLVGSRGTLVTREMMIEHLWGKDVYRETERGINTAINKLRAVLCDDPRQPKFLQTVIGKGYRFLAEVIEVEEHKLPRESVPPTATASAEMGEASPMVPNRNIPPAVERINTKSLATDRVPRSQSVAEMQADRQYVATPRSASGIHVAEPATAAAIAPTSSDSAVPPRVLDQGIRFRRPGRFHAIIHSWQVRIAVGLVAFAIVGGVFLYRGFHKVSAIGPGDPIVLAEFTNTTGDTVFDGSLNRALAAGLSQSPYIRLLTPQKVAATLRTMERPPGDRLTKDIAREVCVRSGSKAYIVGAISQSANKYPITVKAFNCETNALVASANAEAESRNEVLSKLGDAATELRRKLGESLPSVEKHNHPMYQLVTTSSLAALQAAELGNAKYGAGDFQGAIAAYQNAVTLDPNFAAAYLWIGGAYANFGQAETAKPYLQRAHELRDRMTDNERLNFETMYYDSVTGETDKEMQAFAELAKLMPNNSDVPMNMGCLYEQLGQYDKALEKASEASRKQSNSFIIHDNTMAIYRSLGRYDEAIAVYDDAASQKILNTDARLQRYLVAFIQNDKVTMRQQIDAMNDMPNGREFSLQAQANTAEYEGRLREARALAAQAAEAAIGGNQAERAAHWKGYQAVLESEFGNSARARNLVTQALSLDMGRETKQYAALALARIADITHAQQLADQLNQDAPVSTFVQRYWLPTIRAAIALTQRKPEAAVDALRAAEPYELGFQDFGNLFPVYLRGLAYLALGQGKESAAEFQKFIEHRGIVANNPLGALAQLQLARAYVAAGEKLTAKQKYEDFIALWKDADADVPVLKQAEAEYATMR